MPVRSVHQRGYPRACLLVADVELVRGPRSRQHGHGLLGGREVDVGRVHAGSRFGEGDGDRAPDPGAGPGDERDLLGQREHGRGA